LAKTLRGLDRGGALADARVVRIVGDTGLDFAGVATQIAESKLVDDRTGATSTTMSAREAVTFVATTVTSFRL
jgi:hypothetical protein